MFYYFLFISVHGLPDKEPTRLRDELMPVTFPETCTHLAHSRCSVNGGGTDADEKMSIPDLTYSNVFRLQNTVSRCRSQRDLRILLPHPPRLLLAFLMLMSTTPWLSVTQLSQSSPLCCSNNYADQQDNLRPLLEAHLYNAKMWLTMQLEVVLT